jgi:hypothetical protein
MCLSVWHLRQQEAERVIRRAVVAVDVTWGGGGGTRGHKTLRMFLYLRIGFLGGGGYKV